MSGIYLIISILKPSKIYIGSAIDLEHRKRQHFHLLKYNKHFNKKLQNHYNKYGESDLQFSILLGCDKEDLIKIEQYFIDILKPWFNNAPIAGSNLGMKHSKKTRKKISMIQIGRKLSEEHKRKIGEGNKGKILSEKTKQKIGLGNKGKIRTEAIKRKWSESHKGLKNNLGKKRSEESKKKQSEKMKGRRTCPEFTEETRQKIRLKLMGNKNNLSGKKRREKN